MKKENKILMAAASTGVAANVFIVVSIILLSRAILESPTEPLVFFIMVLLLALPALLIFALVCVAFSFSIATFLGALKGKASFVKTTLILNSIISVIFVFPVALIGLTLIPIPWNFWTLLVLALYVVSIVFSGMYLAKATPKIVPKDNIQATVSPILKHRDGSVEAPNRQQANTQMQIARQQIQVQSKPKIEYTDRPIKTFEEYVEMLEKQSEKRATVATNSNNNQSIDNEVKNDNNVVKANYNVVKNNPAPKSAKKTAYDDYIKMVTQQASENIKEDNNE